MSLTQSFKARLLLDWLGSPGNKGTEVGYKVARRAAQDIGVCEDPPGSNRGIQIDEYNITAHSPLGSYWCATACGFWYKHARARVPQAYGNCDKWLEYGNKWNSIHQEAAIGAVALYGTSTDIVHVGVVVRLHPYIMVIEGNTTLAGYSRNGEVVTLKKPIANIVGYYYPLPELRTATRA